jgi:hypothetical protein
MSESHFDAFRRMGKNALSFSTKWMTEPRRTARNFSESVFAYQLQGANIADAPEAVSQSIYTNAIISGRWAMCGFPTVNMGHKTAAAFCATKMRPEDAAEFVRPPWPAFCIRLPNSLLQIDDSGVLRDASVLMVTAIDPETIQREPDIRDLFEQPPEQHRWWWKIAAPSPIQRPSWFPTKHSGFFDGISLWGYNQATQYLAFPDAGEDDLGYRRWETIKTEDSDKRCERLARALILSTCMYLSGDPRELSQRATEGGVAVSERKSKKREGDEFPQYRSFEVTSSIKINMTETIREYVKHGGSSPTVQTYVQGHWKRVPYGPGATQRKLTHVQAYWRGDLNSPVSARTK